MTATVKGRATRPDERQCAMLILHLLATKQERREVTRREVTRREVTRARLSEITLQRLFKRQRISPELLVEVQEWLFRAGWVLFFTGTTYAVVKTEVIDGWGRISSKRIGEDLVKVGRGEFDFESLEHLLVGSESSGEAED
jgi:hypothetical protein